MTHGPSQYDLDHIEEILFDGHGDWFGAHLLRLIRKADVINRELLRLVFPHHVEAVEAWYKKEDPE